MDEALSLPAADALDILGILSVLPLLLAPVASAWPGRCMGTDDELVKMERSDSRRELNPLMTESLGGASS